MNGTLLLTGLKPDGSIKVRPIDDMSASDINAATGVSEKLVYDTLDTYVEMLRSLALLVEVNVFVIRPYTRGFAVALPGTAETPQGRRRLSIQAGTDRSGCVCGCASMCFSCCWACLQNTASSPT